MSNPYAIRKSRNDQIFVAFVYVCLFIILILVLYPLIFIVSSSFSSGVAVRSGQVWLYPVQFSLTGYQAIFENRDITRGFLNTVIYTGSGTAIAVVLTIALAYPLSKSVLVGRNIIMVLLVITMLFDGGLIPYFLTVKSYGLLNTRWAMILPGAVSVWQVIVARTFFQMNIPIELSEAAELDGCSDFKFLYMVVIPLSMPIIAVLVLMYAVGIWNSYFDGLIFLRDPRLFPLQLILRDILILNKVDNQMMMNIDDFQRKQDLAQLLKYSLIVVSSVPILIFYPFIQKYFVKGVLIGSIKG